MAWFRTLVMVHGLGPECRFHHSGKSLSIVATALNLDHRFRKSFSICDWALYMQDHPQRQTKAETAVAAIREAIYSGRYRGGEKLSQTRVAIELNLSPTPVREAFRVLLAQRLVVQRAHHSVEVVQPDLEQVKRIYSVRALLEAEAVRLATPNLSRADFDKLALWCGQMQMVLPGNSTTKVRDADGAFHQLIYDRAGNPLLVGLINQLWGAFPRYLLWSVPGRINQSVAEHMTILKALRKGDADSAAAAVKHHLKNALSALSNAIAADDNAASAAKKTVGKGLKKRPRVKK